MTIMIDDDNDVVVETKKDSDKEVLKKVIKQGLQDAEDIVILLDKLINLLEPFGDSEGLESLKVIYEEAVPSILLGKYDELKEMLRSTSNESDELLEMRLALQRKEYVEGLMNKYNK